MAVFEDEKRATRAKNFFVLCDFYRDRTELLKESDDIFMNTGPRHPTGTKATPKSRRLYPRSFPHSPPTQFHTTSKNYGTRIIFFTKHFIQRRSSPSTTSAY